MDFAVFFAELMNVWPRLAQGAVTTVTVSLQACPSSNDLRLFLLLKIGVSGSVWGLI